MSLCCPSWPIAIANLCVPTLQYSQGEGGGSRGGLAGLRARGVPFDPKLEELEQQRRKLAEVGPLSNMV